MATSAWLSADQLNPVMCIYSLIQLDYNDSEELLLNFYFYFYFTQIGFTQSAKPFWILWPHLGKEKPNLNPGWMKPPVLPEQSIGELDMQEG